jgi:hypothetical protein
MGFSMIIFVFCFIENDLFPKRNLVHGKRIWYFENIFFVYVYWATKRQKLK